MLPYGPKDNPRGSGGHYTPTPTLTIFNWKGGGGLQLYWPVAWLVGDKVPWSAWVVRAKAAMIPKGSEPLGSSVSAAGTSRAFTSLHCSLSHCLKPAPSHFSVGTPKPHGLGRFLWLVSSRLFFIRSYPRWGETYALMSVGQTAYQMALSRHRIIASQISFSFSVGNISFLSPHYDPHCSLQFWLWCCHFIPGTGWAIQNYQGWRDRTPTMCVRRENAA